MLVRSFNVFFTLAEFLKHISAVIPTVKGDVRVDLKNRETYQLIIKVPAATIATVYIPSIYKKILLNGEEITSSKREADFILFEVTPGNHTIEAKEK